MQKQEGEQPNNPCIVLLDYWAKLLDTFLFIAKKILSAMNNGSITLKSWP